LDYDQTAVQNPGCPICGAHSYHRPEQCPAVLAVEYFENGSLKRIEKRDSWFPFPTLKRG